MCEHDLLLSPSGAPTRLSGALVQILRVGGRLDATTDEAFLAGVGSAGEDLRARADGEDACGIAGSRTLLLLDLDEVSWCDSRGLGALVRAVAIAVHRGVSLRLAAGPTSAASRIISRVAMAEVLALGPSVGHVLADPHPCPLEAELDP